MKIELAAAPDVVDVFGSADTEKVSHSLFQVASEHKQRAFMHYHGLAHNYQAQFNQGLGKFFRDRERNAILELAAFQSGRSMIDVGTGSGLYALLAKKKGMTVCAVDFVPEMVNCLSDQVDEVLVGDIETFSHKSEFDNVVCAGVLDFVLAPETAFANLAKLVAKGGQLTIQVPRKSIGGFIYRVQKWRHGINVNVFTQSWFIKEGKKAGLTFDQVRKPLPHNIVVRFVRD